MYNWKALLMKFWRSGLPAWIFMITVTIGSLLGLKYQQKSITCQPDQVIVKEYSGDTGNLLTTTCKRIEDTLYGYQQRNLK